MNNLLDRLEDNLPELLIGVVVLLAAVFSIDLFAANHTKAVGTVIERVYVPSSNAYGYNAKGEYVNMYTPDDFTLMVRRAAGVDKVSTSQQGYYSVKPGQTITYRLSSGRITGIGYGASY